MSSAGPLAATKRRLGILRDPAPDQPEGKIPIGVPPEDGARAGRTGYQVALPISTSPGIAPWRCRVCPSRIIDVSGGIYLAGDDSESDRP